MNFSTECASQIQLDIRTKWHLVGILLPLHLSGAVDPVIRGIRCNPCRGTASAAVAGRRSFRGLVLGTALLPPQVVRQVRCARF